MGFTVRQDLLNHRVVPKILHIIPTANKNIGDIIVLFLPPAQSGFGTTTVFLRQSKFFQCSSPTVPRDDAKLAGMCFWFPVFPDGDHGVGGVDFMGGWTEPLFQIGLNSSQRCEA